MKNKLLLVLLFCWQIHSICGQTVVLDSLWNLAEDAKNDSLKMAFQSEIFDKWVEVEPSKAILFFQKNKAQYQLYPSIYSSILRHIARGQEILGKHRQSFELLNECIALNTDSFNYYYAYFQKGTLHYWRLEFPSAVDCLEKSQSYFSRTMNGDAQQKVYNTLGAIWALQGERRKAEDSYLRSIEVAEQDQLSLADKTYPVYNLGLLYLEMGDYAKAFYYITRFEKMVATLPNAPASEGLKRLAYLDLYQV